MAAQENNKKYLDFKASLYLKKFGIGIYIEKTPMIFPYKYKLGLQIAWLELTLILIFKRK